MIAPPRPESFESPALTRVARGDLCAGCGGCAAVAPGKVAMQMVEPGYLRPVQSAPLDPAEEETIAAICPGLGQAVVPGDRQTHVLWGPYREMRTGWATDPDLRHAGSSGGALSMVLVHLIETGAVDAVIQTGAHPGIPIANTTVLSTDVAGITQAAGSRYAPSAPLDGLRARIADGRRYAFVGKPCDAAALRTLVARDPDLGAAIPIILSFFCAGVPSQAGAGKVLETLGTTLADTAAFRFRGNGWPGRATATARDGTERSMTYFESWGKILNRHVQHRCKICADGSGVAADIVCADAWEADETGYPVFADKPGVSLIVARTDLGVKLLSEAESAGRLVTKPFDVDGLAKIQPGQSFRRRGLLGRLAALKVMGRPIPRYTGLSIRASARTTTLKRNLSAFVGMLRRIT